MKAIQIISQDLFDKIRSRFSNLEMGDETGAVTIDPAYARYYDFDFVSEGNNLGRVSISLGDLGSLKVYYSQGITENQDDPAKQEWYSFLKEMRFFAMRRLLRFDTRDIAKTNLDKNDFKHLATTQAPKQEEPDMTTMNESKWQKNTKKTSRAVKGSTQVIVRHKDDFQETYAGSRSQPKHIKAIFIQNADGERFKYPFIHTEGAFAMAQHVDHGGIPHDPAGKAIIRMSEEIAKLGKFRNTIKTANLHDDALGITDRAIGRLQELKMQVRALGKRHHYESWMETFNESDMIDDELDPVTMEEYKSKFTQSSFKEELAGFFPLLHRIMSETNKVNLDDYVKESEEETKYTVHCSQCGNEFKRDKEEGYSHCKDHKIKEDAFDQFEEWANSVEDQTLTPDQLDQLKTNIDNELENKFLPLDGAWDWLNGSVNPEGQGSDFPDDLQGYLQDIQKNNPEQNGLVALKNWMEKTYSGDQANNMMQTLGIDGMSDDEPKEPEQAKPAQPKPAAPAQPKPAPQQPAQDAVPPGMAENGEMDGPANSMMPAEGKDSRSEMTKMIAEKVKSFYNISNEGVAPFRAEENIATEVKKEVEEKFGEAMGEQAREMAIAFMEKKNSEWKATNGNAGDDDMLSRMKQLVGTIKSKVDSFEKPTDEGQVIQGGPRPEEVPAYLRKSQEPGKQAAQAATDQRNKNAGAKVWSSPRLPETTALEAIMKLAGLAK